MDDSSTKEEIEAAKSGIGLIAAIKFYLILMPAALSLLPAVSRACVRIKTFLPQSLVPGWGLIACLPLSALVSLAMFVLLYHVAGNVLLILGLVLWVGAPLLYLSKFHLLTRPVTAPHDLDALAKTQMVVMGTIACGALLLVVYLFTAKFFGKTIVG